MLKHIWHLHAPPRIQESRVLVPQGNLLSTHALHCARALLSPLVKPTIINTTRPLACRSPLPRFAGRPAVIFDPNRIGLHEPDCLLYRLPALHGVCPRLHRHGSSVARLHLARDRRLRPSPCAVKLRLGTLRRTRRRGCLFRSLHAAVGT